MNARREVTATVAVPTVNAGRRLRRLLRSLHDQTQAPQVVVVNNDAPPEAIEPIARDFPAVDIVDLDRNVGFSAAINLAARRADGEALIVVNDDCVCEPRFVESLAGGLDAGHGVVMAAGVLVEARDPNVIDSAGMELDETLLVFDYLNGTPVETLTRGVSNPIGPSGAAAAFDRAAFLSIGGFDEHLFAYWEDVDLVLRLRREGGTCVLTPDARGLHEHSATLGSGSPEKDYLMGFGRGYILKKWGVLDRPSRIAATLARDVVLCAGQALLDGTTAGVRGRFDGYRAAPRPYREPYPQGLLGSNGGLGATLRRRLARRVRLNGSFLRQ
jgi:GT2 family glycosyltransferase